jgi:hypothetical protein
MKERERKREIGGYRALLLSAASRWVAIEHPSKRPNLYLGNQLELQPPAGFVDLLPDDRHPYQWNNGLIRTWAPDSVLVVGMAARDG